MATKKTRVTELTFRHAKTKDKGYKIRAEDGLYMYVSPSGGKLWRFDYSYAGKRRTASLGKYPDVPLGDASSGDYADSARGRRDAVRRMLAVGKDPAAEKRAKKAEVLERAATTFQVVAQQWFEFWKTGVSPETASRVWSNLSRHILPDLGKLPLAEVTSKVILATLRKLEAAGKGFTARKVKTSISQIFNFAAEKEIGGVTGDPASSLKGKLKAVRGGHRPAITDPVKVGQLLRAIDGYQGQAVVCAALRLLPLVFARPGELRTAKWAEINLDEGTWSYFVTKTKKDHLVPLASQAVAILRELHPITGGNRHGFVFPGRNPGKVISDNTLNAALRSMGYDTKTEHCAHGFRATATTLLEERLGFDSKYTEFQLSHGVPGYLGPTYRRAEFLKERREMMQAWADYLDSLKAGAEVIPIFIAKSRGLAAVESCE
jgi:integrase